MPGKKTIALLLVLALLFFADRSARHYEESQIARSIKTSLDLKEEPEVALRGFPFLTEMVQGRISSCTVSVDSLVEGRIRFSNIQLLLVDLTFSVRQFLERNLRAIHARRGVGTASIRQNDLNTFLRAHGVPFMVSFRNGQTVAQLSSLSAPIDLGLKISDGSLEISAGSLPTVSVPLPSALHGIVYGSARPGRGRLLLNFRLEHPTLDLTR